MASIDRRRPLKIVTGVSGSPKVYAAAIDPGKSTLTDLLTTAELAEQHGFDALFAADLLSFAAQGAIGAQEPLIVLSALSAVTAHVGLIATVTTTFHHPYNLARLFGTLDHISNGRAAWNAVTSSVGEENYGAGELPSPEQRYSRAAESIEVVNALFDSWGPDALQADGRGGAVLDAARARPRPRRCAWSGNARRPPTSTRAATHWPICSAARSICRTCPSTSRFRNGYCPR